MGRHRHMSYTCRHKASTVPLLALLSPAPNLYKSERPTSPTRVTSALCRTMLRSFIRSQSQDRDPESSFSVSHMVPFLEPHDRKRPSAYYSSMVPLDRNRERHTRGLCSLVQKTPRSPPLVKWHSWPRPGLEPRFIKAPVAYLTHQLFIDSLFAMIWV